MTKLPLSLPPKTFIFYDESGDTGTKFGKGSTDFFIATVLVVPRFRMGKIDEILAKIRVKYQYFSEIKYSKIKGKLLEDLIINLSTIKDIRAFSLIVDKRNYSGQSLTQKVKNKTKEKHRFSDFCTMYAVKKAKDFMKDKLVDAELLLDRIERQNEENFGCYLFNSLNKQSLVIGRITHADSLCIPGIQMTDLISGIIRDEVEKKTKTEGHSELWRIIKVFTRINNIEREINLKRIKVE